jgi:tripartite-type tricarboxylate transporter receptor subunit TctC
MSEFLLAATDAFTRLGNSMKFSRRRFLQLATLPAASQIARALDSYPTRPVHLLVGYAAGGPADTIARLTAQWLSERLGQQVIVENRAGAASNIAAEAVMRSPPDGYTLLFVTVSNAVNATLYDRLSFDLVRDMVPIASITRSPGVLEVNPSFPAKTVLEFIAYAKANPGKINMASAGPGSAPHLYTELFKMMTGVDVVQIHYRGSGPALPDLLEGQIQGMFDPIASSIGHIRAGKLRPLAVTTATRLEVLPDIPTVGEFVPGYEASGWYGIGAPKDTPAEIVNRLNIELNAALADPRIKARLADLGTTVIPASPADFGKLFADETEKWAKVIRTRNMKPE